jgi:hypothetical protein
MIADNVTNEYEITWQNSITKRGKGYCYIQAFYDPQGGDAQFTVGRIPEISGLVPKRKPQASAC